MTQCRSWPNMACRLRRGRRMRSTNSGGPPFQNLLDPGRSDEGRPWFYPYGRPPSTFAIVITSYNTCGFGRALVRTSIALAGVVEIATNLVASSLNLILGMFSADVNDLRHSYGVRHDDRTRKREQKKGYPASSRNHRDPLRYSRDLNSVLLSRPHWSTE